MTAAARAPQEQRLRPTAGLRGNPAMALSAWKGRSGRRYVVGVHELLADALADIGACVALAVVRDEDGIAIAQPPKVFEASATDAQRRAWIERSRRDGASELHAHRLAASVAERAAVAADLGP